MGLIFPLYLSCILFVRNLNCLQTCFLKTEKICALLIMLSEGFENDLIPSHHVFSCLFIPGYVLTKDWWLSVICFLRISEFSQPLTFCPSFLQMATCLPCFAISHRFYLHRYFFINCCIMLRRRSITYIVLIALVNHHLGTGQSRVAPNFFIRQMHPKNRQFPKFDPVIGLSW